MPHHGACLGANEKSQRFGKWLNFKRLPHWHMLRNPAVNASMNLLRESKSGTRTHLGGFNARPAWVLQSLNMGYIILRCLSCLRTIPISSAQALTIPACLLRRALSKLTRNGSMALLDRKADDAGQPFRTPEKKRIKTCETPLCSYDAMAFFYKL